MFTTNPKFGEIDAVAEPLAILNASSESADWGILLSCEPSPLNEPLNEPLNSSAIIIGTSNESDIDTLPLNSDFTDSDANTLNIPSVETDAVTEPVVIKFESKASSTNAERGILNNPSPLPLKNPLWLGISKLPLTITDPLNSEVTDSDENTLKNPSGVTDAVTEPDDIKFDISASSTRAVFGILNKFAPLPLNDEPLLSCKLPLINVEPLSSVLTEPVPNTLNTPSGVTDAVTEPVAIKFDINASSVSAVLGMLNKSSPLPLNTEPLASLTSPKKVDPLSTEVTTNPSTGETDAVTEPLLILLLISASSVSADFGISNKSLPLPLNTEPLTNLTSPSNKEPLSTEVTLNWLSSVDAVILPLPMNIASLETNAVIDSWASVERAANGISNKSLPLPLNDELTLSWTAPLTNTEPLNSDFTEPVDSTLKTPAGSNEAVTEPVTILDESNASSVNAVLGISNKFAPLPLYFEPDDRVMSPLKVEPLGEKTAKPLSGETDADIAPLIIKFVSNASSVSAERGMSNKFAPLPLYLEPLLSCKFPLTKREPLNSVVTDPVPNTLKNPSWETDAVTEPVVIKFESNASSVSADFGILNKFSPLPLNEEPLLSCKLPLINVEPLNSVVTEPVPNTLKNPSSETDAVTDPVVIKFDNSASSVSADFGISNNPSPLPE